MYILQKINVQKIAKDEKAKAKLIAHGFVELIKKEIKKVEPKIEEVKENKKNTKKGKE